MPIGDVAPEIALILTAVICLLFATFAPRRWQSFSAAIALAGLAVTAILLAHQIGSIRLSFSGVWAIDGVSVWARFLILGGTALTVVLSPAWFASDSRHGEFYAILLFSALGAMGMAAAADLLELVMAVLLSSVTGYTLAAYHRDWAPSVEAGMKYFLVGALANAVLAIGVTLVYGMVGATGYGEMAGRLTEAASSPLLLLGVALTLVGLAFKLGAVPGHAWVPDVAEGAPAPAAAFLTVVPKIGAAIALVRLVALFPPDAFAVRPLVAVLATATMTIGNLAAIWQQDVRRLIGWSSVSQSGYALMAVAVIGSAPAAEGALLIFLAAYTIANFAAFAVIVHLRGRTAIDDFAGLATLHPVAAAALTVAFLSLTGIPPLAGFIGKFELFRVAIAGDYGWLAVVAVANTVASLFYYLRVVGPMVFESPDRKAHVLGRASLNVALLASALTVLAGLAGQLLFDTFWRSALLP